MLCWHCLIKSWAFNSALPLRCDFPGHPCHSRFLPGVELLIVWGTFHRFFPPDWNQFHCHETQLHLSPMLSWQTPSPWNCHFEKTRYQLSKPFWNASEIYIPVKKQQNKTKTMCLLPLRSGRHELCGSTCPRLTTCPQPSVPWSLRCHLRGASRHLPQARA